MSAKVPRGMEERFYRLALMGCGEPMLGVRVNGEGYPQPFWLANEAAQRLLGYSARALQRLSLLSLGLSREDVRQLLRGGTLYGSLMTGQGQAVYLEMRTRWLEGGYAVVSLRPWGTRLVSQPESGSESAAEREGAVLAQAAAALSRAASLVEIAGVAVTMGRELFQTQRAALLLRDRQGEARFYRAIGLSEEFQRAVEAFRREKVRYSHQSPLFFGDVTQVPFPANMQKQFQRERVGALAVFPLVCEAECWGDLVIYYEEPHAFSVRERHGGQTLAALVAGAIARQRRWDDWVGVLEHAGEVLFAMNTRWHWTYLNPAWEALTGYKVSESLHTSFLDGVHPEDVPRVLARLDALEEGETGPFAFRYRGRNGEERWLEMSPTRHADPWGEWIGVAGVLRDVGDRLAWEQQRCREVEAALAQTQELHTHRNEFFAMAAHELRTPIGAILSNVNILEYTCDRGNPKVMRALQRIQQSLRELLGVLNDVLAIGRLDAGKVEFQPRWLDLRDLCEHRLEELAVTDEAARRVRFTCHVPRVPFYGDAKLLRHLLANLIANGLKYSPSDRPVEVTLTAEDHRIAIAVRDYGIGIAEADRARLFEPFFRGQNVGSATGSGLGLAIVKRYADLHGARLTCESHLGEGSTFRVEFPVPLSKPVEAMALQ